MTTIERKAAYCTSTERGVLHAAFRVKADDGREGWAFFEYEWDKRDIMAERLYAEPCIADALREEIPEEGPSVLSVFITSQSEGSMAVLNKAQEKATEAVYEY